MTAQGIYLDEDTQSTALIGALRAMGITVTTTTEAEMSHQSDEEQLRFAADHNLVLTSCNVADFARIHSTWSRSGFDHKGIILIQQQKWGPGELARRIVRLVSSAPAEGFRNRLEFISNW